MKRVFWIWVVMVVLTALFAARNLRFARRDPVTGPPPQEAHSPVTVFISSTRPRRRDFPLTVPWVGEVESRRTVPLTALEAGRIVSIFVADEAEVSKGTVLLKLGGSMVQRRLSVMRTRIAALRQRLELAQQRVVHKRDAVAEKISALDDLLRAQDTLAQRQAELTDALQAQQAFAARLTLRAPMAGVFTQRRVSVGQDVVQGTALATVLDPTHLRIEATVFLPEATSLRGRKAVIAADSGPPLTGTVNRILPRRTPAGGTRVWIEGKALDRVLRPGQAVRGALWFDTHTAALAVPQSAVVYDAQETPYVFVQDRQGFTRQRVRTGRTLLGWVEILHGLEATHQVVTQGAYELFYQDFNQVYKVAD